MELKLQLLDADKWGVYVRPIGVTPGPLTITGTAQVTVVMPKDFAWTGLQSVSGTWASNATVNGPTENPTAKYVSFGLTTDFPHIDYVAGDETLLFTFLRTDPCPDTMYIIDNNTDPFAVIPNSQNSNPGNEFSVFDPTGGLYEWLGIYSPSAWSCHDCDGDGILNGFEDTDGDGVYDATVEDANGNGVLDPGEDLDGDGYLDPDVSAICDPCDPFHPEAAALELIGGADVICAGDVGDTAWFKVTIEGGWPPYTVNYTDGTTAFSEPLYYSGDSIWFIPTASVVLDITSIVDSFNCLLDTALTGGLVISVHGPISITDEPDDVVECSGNSTQFCVATQNLGDGDTYKKWQQSIDNGVTWVDIQDGGVFDNTDSLCMDIANVANKHNYQYRCKIFTDVCDTVYSAAALLEVEGPITISTHPADFTNCETEDAAFTAASVNAGAVGTMVYQWQESADGVTWNDISGATAGATHSTFTTTTLNLAGISVSLDGHYYRMKVSTGECAFVYTNAARLNVSGAISVTDDPDNISNCAGSEVNFIAAFNNAGASYPLDPQQTVTSHIWQIADASTGPWANLTNAGLVYTGISGTNTGAGASDTLTISNVVGLNGKWYRICYTTATCSVPVYSAAAQLQVSGNVAFSDDPDDITVCSGSGTTFTAVAAIPQGTFSFGWQYSDDNGANWVDIDFVAMAALFSHSETGTIAAGTDVLTVTNVATMYGRRFRTVANATDCNSVYSNYGILSVEGPLSVNTQPTAVVECSGNSTVFNASFDNPGVAGSTIYRWQLSIDGGTSWNNLSNNTTYSGTATTQLAIFNVAGLHGYCYRLSARTSTCATLFTNSACLTVEGPITVTTQPTTVDLCSNDATSFFSDATVGTAGTFDYQWQVTSDNLNWSDIDGTTDGGVYSGETTTTLNVSAVANLYSRCYRLAFSTGECNRVFSNAACMNIDGPLSFGAHPTSITQCSGEAIIFGAVALTGSLEADSLAQIQYNWQENTGTGWVDLVNDTLYNGINTDTMSISYTTNMDGNCYRLKIWTDNCDTIYSNQACVDVEGPMLVTDEPDNITECSGSGVTFQSTVSLQNGDPSTLIYQWEVSAYNQGTSTYGAYTDIVNGGVYSGATTTTLAISDVAGMYQWRFRMRFRTPNCDAKWSNYAQITVEGPIDFAVGGQPVSVVECSGNAANFSVVTTNTGQGAITYQWQVSTTGSGGPWFNLNNGSIYNGTKTANLSLANVAGFNGYCYKCLIQTTECASVESDEACLAVEGPISFTDHPDDITQCSGEGVTFTGAAAIAVGNVGTMTYQWQWSDDASCTNYSDIVAAGANGFADWNTPTLTVGNVVGIDGRCFRLAVNTGECNYVYSFPAKLKVEGPLTVTTNPVDFTNCSDKEALFFSKASNPSLGGQSEIVRQWQVSSDNGVTWIDIIELTQTINGNIINFGGYNSDSLLISPIIGLNGYMFRNNFWTSSCNLITTTAAVLNVEGPITFTDQPDDVTLCSNDATSFTIAIANSTGVGVVSYQWQKWSVTGWQDLANTGVYTGAFSLTLNISNVTGLYNSKFRCKVKTVNCDWGYSDLANLFVEGPITIDLQPVDANICSNRPHLFNTTITNPGYGQMTYRWWYKKPSGVWTAFVTNLGNLSTLGVVNPTDPLAKWQGAYGQDLNLTNTDGLNGWQFRLAITMPHCAGVTNEVTLTVLDKCLSGDCDLDNDGIINDDDPDDDNDQLSDYWEAWMTDNNLIVSTTDFAGTGPWNYTVDGSGVTLPYISYNRCLVDTDGDGLYDNQEDPDGDNINNGEETDSDGIFDGNPLDPCNPILGPTCIGINLAIKVGLQGAHIGLTPTEPLSRATLRSYGVNQEQLIPTTEPFTDISNTNGSPFLHNGPDGGGTEVITDPTTTFAVSNEDAIVDWVFVELRSSTSLDSVATTRAGLLQRDGDVVDMDGVSNLRFPFAAANTYYVSVRHRNHLGIMTNEALDLSPALQTIDFTDIAFPVNGTYPTVTIGGKRYMWAGDLNSDGRTVYQGPGNDVLTLFTTVLYDSGNTSLLANFISDGYLEADVNLDGRAIYQGPANDRSMLLLYAILSHPANVNLISNYVILEMLP
ncbi:MAG: hypothetical protein K9J45_14630 [Bacteroidales bacterium]|nr:hypothetical protein [Bacteroidales bacterium]